MKASMTDIYAKRPAAFTETTIDDETVVMSLESGDFFSLTGTAQAIWGLIDGQRDGAAIAASLARNYGAEPGDLTEDIGEFLGDLAAAGLIALH
jgi:pyrroloquinoline quinone biosynthesis protein D